MKTVRVLLVSTYDLGRQPFGLASPAAWLRRAGVEVDCIDTSREELSDEVITPTERKAANPANVARAVRPGRFHDWPILVLPP